MPDSATTEPIETARRPRRGGPYLVMALLAASLFAIAAGWLFDWRSYRIWSARRALAHGNPERALRWLEPDMASTEPETVRLIAQAYLARGNPGLAIGLLQSRIRDRPEASLMCELGIALMTTGDRMRALHIFESLDRSHPHSPQILVRLAELKEQLRSPSQAVTVWEQLEKLEPANPEWPKRRGLVYLTADRHPLAIEAFEKSMEHDPNDFETRIWLAEARFLAGDPAAALEILESMSRDRFDERVETPRAECLRALGRIHEATSTLDKVIERGPRNSDAMRLRAEMAIASGHFAMAIGLLERARAISPEDPRISYQLSIAMARAGPEACSAERQPRVAIDPIRSGLDP